jgi:Rap1a immunity proteins
MKKLLVLSALFFAGFSAPIYAQDKALSTAELVKFCQLPASSEHRSFCVGYSTAIYDTYLVTRHPTNAKPFICLNQPAPPVDTVIADYVNWAKQNQQFMNTPAADSALRYLAGRFPCTKK